MADRRVKYRTGNTGLDDQIAALVAAAGVGQDEDLVFEMIVSAVRMGRESADRPGTTWSTSASSASRFSSGSLRTTQACS